MNSFPILTVLVLVPLAGALLVMLIGHLWPDLVRLVAWLTAIATGAFSLWLLASFDSGDAGFQFVSQHEWIEHWGISWYLGVDGISLLLVVLTGILFPLAFFTTDPHNDERPYFAWMLLLVYAVTTATMIVSVWRCGSSGTCASVAFGDGVLTVVVLSGFFGLVAGAYSGPAQAVAAAIKLPFLFFATFAVCFPAFFVVTRSSSRMTATERRASAPCGVQSSSFQPEHHFVMLHLRQRPRAKARGLHLHSAGYRAVGRQRFPRHHATP